MPRIRGRIGQRIGFGFAWGVRPAVSAGLLNVGVESRVARGGGFGRGVLRRVVVRVQKEALTPLRAPFVREGEAREPRVRVAGAGPGGGRKAVLSEFSELGLVRVARASRGDEHARDDERARDPPDPNPESHGASSNMEPRFLERHFCPAAALLLRARRRAPLADVKGDARVIDLLNDVLTGELTAINQYFLHARMCANWGYRYLAEHIRKESIDEMKHADMLIERVLFLDGLPNLQKLGMLSIGTTVVEMLANDLEVERTAIPLLNRGIQLCRDVGDNGSEDLLTRILVSEEAHVDWIESQLELVKQVGAQIYLAQQIHE
jgi:bacterioferritin